MRTVSTDISPPRYSKQRQHAWLGSEDVFVIIASPKENAGRIFKNARFKHTVLEFIFALIVSIAIALVVIKKKGTDRP